MEFTELKGLLALLFFGSVFAFGFWQLAVLRRGSRQRTPTDQTQTKRDRG
jgi:hypothetical protein